MTSGADRILRTIASEIRARPEQVKVAIDLFDEGDTVPFVARYRKEATGGLDDAQFRQLEERLAYSRERGLGPLADAILADRTATPAELAKAYLSDSIPDIKTALLAIARAVNGEPKVSRSHRARRCDAPSAGSPRLKKEASAAGSGETAIAGAGRLAQSKTGLSLAGLRPLADKSHIN